MLSLTATISEIETVQTPIVWQRAIYFNEQAPDGNGVIPHGAS